jgi:NADH:ubiquinone oxidoreductase subunit 4 (subunit M)
LEILTNGVGLSAVVFFPLVSALVITLIPKGYEFIIKVFALISSIITFVLSIVLLLEFDFSSAEKLQLGNKISWIKEH